MVKYGGLLKVDLNFLFIPSDFVILVGMVSLDEKSF